MKVSEVRKGEPVSLSLRCSVCVCVETHDTHSSLHFYLCEDQQQLPGSDTHNLRTMESQAPQKLPPEHARAHTHTRTHAPQQQHKRPLKSLSDLPPSPAQSELTRVLINVKLASYRPNLPASVIGTRGNSLNNLR